MLNLEVTGFIRFKIKPLRATAYSGFTSFFNLITPETQHHMAQAGLQRPVKRAVPTSS